MHVNRHINVHVNRQIKSLYLPSALPIEQADQKVQYSCTFKEIKFRVGRGARKARSELRIGLSIAREARDNF